jgi:hypothetical protein
MRPAIRPALAASLLGLFFVQHAAAQVYQCLDANGKKVFSQTPCSAQGGGSEKLIMQKSAAVEPPAGAAPLTGKPVGGAPKDWAAENAAANARAAAAEASAGASRQAAPSSPGGLRKGGTQPQPSDKQIIASCEANHGARCNSAGEIAQRRMEQRELTASERQQQQSAVAARRQREKDEAFNRYLNR